MHHCHQHPRERPTAPAATGESYSMELSPGFHAVAVARPQGGSLTARGTGRFFHGLVGRDKALQCRRGLFDR